MSGKYYDSVHLASDQKDLLISQLKAEIFEIQQRDKDYLSLRDTLYAIQQKYRHMQDEKLMQDNDYNYRHDQNVVTINSLRKEIEDLRYLLNEKVRSNNEFQAEIGSVRDQISRREQECVALQREVSVKTDQSYALRKDGDNLQYELAKLRDEKALDQDEINRLRDAAAGKDRECQDNDARIKSIDYDLFKAHERANELSKLADAREFELRKTHDQLDGAVSELGRSKDEHSRLMVESQSLQRNLDGQLGQKSDLTRQCENEDIRNRELSSTVHDRDGRLRAVDDQLCISRKEQENIRFSNNNLLDRNQDTKAEIDALNAHCNVLGGQNKDLNLELERFVHTDEQIRATLNRRDHVIALREAGHAEIVRSQFEVDRHSPLRR